jgi:hypothetical protein
MQRSLNFFHDLPKVSSALAADWMPPSLRLRLLRREQIIGDKQGRRGLSHFYWLLAQSDVAPPREPLTETDFR